MLVEPWNNFFKSHIFCCSISSLYLQNEKKSSPFISVACQKVMEKIKKFAEENNYSLEEYNMKRRQAKIVTKSFHGAGIVVPYNKKTQLGYRHLVENDGL